MLNLESLDVVSKTIINDLANAVDAFFPLKPIAHNSKTWCEP